MTKCTVLGKSHELKSIDFAGYLGEGNKFYFDESIAEAVAFENVELISLGRADNMDIMFAYDDDRSIGQLFIGYWNDGVA